MCLDDGHVCIFGYGSLMWRPGFHYERKFSGYIKGFKRRFWQSCQHHRGTSASPGRVVTIIQDDNGSMGEHVFGICYIVRAEIAQKVIEDLDIREQGGYERKFLPVYVAMQSNGAAATPVEVIAATAHVYVCIKNNPELVLNEDDESVAQVIAKSVGPSGRNCDYLFNLAKCLRNQLQCHDEHVFKLEKRVHELQQLHQQHIHHTHYICKHHHQHNDQHHNHAAQHVNNCINSNCNNNVNINTLHSATLLSESSALLIKQHLAQNDTVPSGTLVIDAGATSAISNRFKALLPIGIVQVQGQFERGGIVWVVESSPMKRKIAKAITNFSSAEIEEIKGKHSKYVKAIVPDMTNNVNVIERDKMILL